MYSYYLLVVDITLWNYYTICQAENSYLMDTCNLLVETSHTIQFFFCLKIPGPKEQNLLGDMGKVINMQQIVIAKILCFYNPRDFLPMRWNWFEWPKIRQQLNVFFIKRTLNQSTDVKCNFYHRDSLYGVPIGFVHSFDVLLNKSVWKHWIFFCRLVKYLARLNCVSATRVKTS